MSEVGGGMEKGRKRSKRYFITNTHLSIIFIRVTLFSFILTFLDHRE